jgi:hypothetical protein
MFFAGAAVLAVVHVVGVLMDGPLWRFAELGTFGLLSVYAALAGTPFWWGPVALSPLLVDALLTLPPAGPATYGWQVLSTDQLPRNLVLDALDQGFRLAGPALLAVLALLVARRGGWRSSGRVVVAAGLALAVVGYAVVRVGGIVGYLHGHPSDGSGGWAVAVAVLVPVSLAVAALGLAGKAGGWAAPAGGVLIAAGALPMIDSMIGSVPNPYPIEDAGLFAWDAISPSVTLPAPVPALTEALLLAGLLCVVAGLGHSAETNDGAS